MQTVALLSFVLLGFFLFLTCSSSSKANAAPLNELSAEDEGRLSLAFLRFLENLQELESERGIMSPGAKRGLDLGLGRGFSGSEAAKHLMGLAAANFAGGPGRRRRSSHFTA